MKSQDVVAMRLRRLAKENGQSFRLTGVATAGQHANDLEIRYGGRKIYVEIKGVMRAGVDLVLLEKSVRRASVPAEIERVSSAMLRGINVGGARLADLMRAMGNPKPDFLSVLDFFRDNVDPAVGLSEDKNAPPSGKLPKEMQTTSRSVASAVRKIIVDKLVQEENSYLAVHDKSDDEVYVYHTGLGSDLIGAGPIPPFSRVKIDTYGGSSKGATRVAVKSSMALS